MFTQIKLTNFGGLKPNDRIVNIKVRGAKDELPLAFNIFWDGEFKQVEPSTLAIVDVPEVFLGLLGSPDLDYFTIERREALTIEQQKDYAYGRVYRNYRRGLINQDELHERTSKIDVAFQDEIRSGKEYLNSGELSSIFALAGMRVDLINTKGQEAQV